MSLQTSMSLQLPLYFNVVTVTLVQTPLLNQARPQDANHLPPPPVIFWQHQVIGIPLSSFCNYHRLYCRGPHLYSHVWGQQPPWICEQGSRVYYSSDRCGCPRWDLHLSGVPGIYGISSICHSGQNVTLTCITWPPHDTFLMVSNMYFYILGHFKTILPYHKAPLK